MWTENILTILHYVVFKKHDPIFIKQLKNLRPEVFELFNEYWVMFFEDDIMKDRKYIFGPHTLDMRFSEDLPVLNTQGILVR